MTDCNVELAPCPFCGGKPTLETRDVEPQGDPWYGRKDETFVLCDCGACLFDGGFHEGFYDAEKRAIAAWNHRISPCTDEDVERVARAIAASFERGSPNIAAGMRMDWQTWAPEARAAISAMNQIRSTDHE